MLDDSIMLQFKKIGKISYHRIDEKNLFIFPDLPSWIVLNDFESLIFKYLVNGVKKEEIYSKTFSIPSIANFSGYSSDLEQSINILVNKLTARKIYPWPQIAYNAPDAQFYPTHIHLCLTHQCNLRCRHCFLAAGNKKNNELNIIEWKNGFSNVLNYIKNPYITISGGEPTVNPDLLELLIFLKSYGSNLTLYTNGCNEINNHIIDLVDAIQISLEGISSKTHDYIRGTGSFEKTIKSIIKIPKDKLNLAILIMPHNYKELKTKFKNFISKYNIDLANVRMSADLENEGRAKTLDLNFQNFFADYAGEVLEFVSSVYNYKPRLILRNMRNCGIGISIGIDSDGKVYPCDNFYESFATIFDNNIGERLKSIKNINISSEVCNIEQCNFCDLKYICLGGCKIKNKIKNGSYLKPICTEESKKIIYYKLIYDIGV